MSFDEPYAPMHEPKPLVTEKRMNEILARRTASPGTGNSDPALTNTQPQWTAYAWCHRDGKRFLLLDKDRYGAFWVSDGVRTPLGFRDTREDALKLFEGKA